MRVDNENPWRAAGPNGDDVETNDAAEFTTFDTSYPDDAK